jgi:hypothetical protein
VKILIALAIVFAFFGFVGVADKVLNPMTVAMLGVLSYSQLKSREQVSHVTKQWARSRTEIFQRKFPPEYYAAQGSVSHNYFFAGTTMRRTLPVMTVHIMRILGNHGSVRILLPDPNCETLMEMIAATRPFKTPAAIRDDIEYSLKSAEELREGNQGQLEIRTVRFLPGIGINAMDLKNPTGSIMVQMYEYAPVAQSERAPIFFLTSEDRAWFEHFENQIERLWEAADPYESQK